MNLKLQFSLPLSLALCLVPHFLQIDSVAAQQITSDGTTGTTVTNDGNNFTIQDGTRNGGNLFHSFQDFSVPTGGSAFFNNGNGISNILSRVTGGNLSNIDGLIRANGSANLFLINPAGIIFGEGASLNIGGSFYGSTADSILFDDGEFSAVNNLDAPILTINAPIGLNFRDNPNDIVNNSVANEGIGLTVLPEATFALVGGNITFNSGIINAPGANVKFASLASGGNVEIDENLNLTLSENITKADVLFSDAATVDVASDGGGSITIEARNINLNQGSQLVGGIDENLGVTNSQAGDITLNVSDAVNLSGESSIDNVVNSGTDGNSGDININVGSLELIEGSSIGTTTFGQGNAGNVTIRATDIISIDGEDPGDAQSVGGIFSNVQGEAVGNAGGVEIATTNLNLTNGGTVAASTFAQGNAGTVSINATDTISIDGEDQEGFNSQIASSVNSGAVGNAGGVEITTANLNLTNGGSISTITFAEGNAGTITVNASDTISIDGEDPSNDEAVGGIFSSVQGEAVGDAGGVEITTTNLNLSNGGTVSTNTLAQGNAGTVTINATDTISIDGQDLENFNSGIFSNVQGEGVGDAGGVEITTKNLNLTNGGTVAASSFAQGNAGSVSINATDTISVDGQDQEGFNSFIASNVNSGAVGNAGGIEITTVNLRLTNGGTVGASTFAQGNAGTVTIDASDTISIDGLDQEGIASSIASDVNFGAVGNAGGVNITTNNFSLSNGGSISASTAGQGNAGNITIDANSNLEIAGSAVINSSVLATALGQGGQITLTGKTISLSEGAAIGAVTFPNGEDIDTEQVPGGNIELNVSESLSITGNAGLASATSGKGNAGNIIINGQGANIVLEDNVPEGSENVESSGSGLISSSSLNNVGNTIGDAGDIAITAKSLTLSDGGFIDSSAFGGTGNGGDIVISVIENLDITDFSITSATALNGEIIPEGNAGNIAINADSFSFTGANFISTSTFGEGNAGDITVDSNNASLLDDATLTSSTFGVGNSGGVEITTANLNLTNGSTVSASTFAQGNAGTVTINATDTISIDGEDPSDDRTFSISLGKVVTRGVVNSTSNLCWKG